MIKEMSVQQAHELLRRGRVGRLGCVVEGEPYVVPVNYVMDGEVVFIHSLPGRKVEAMRASPRVCLQVDEIRDEFNWKSVLAFGNYEEITDPTERSRALNRLLASFPRLTPVETFIAEDAAAPSPIAFRVRINRLTGVGEGTSDEVARK